MRRSNLCYISFTLYPNPWNEMLGKQQTKKYEVIENRMDYCLERNGPEWNGFFTETDCNGTTLCLSRAGWNRTEKSVPFEHLMHQLVASGLQWMLFWRERRSFS